jgi:hypothetical protein
MPEPSTLEHVANIIIRRTIAEAQDPQQLMDALSRACPFTDDARFHEIWLRALERHGIAIANLPPQKMKLKRDGADSSENL